MEEDRIAKSSGVILKMFGIRMFAPEKHHWFDRVNEMSG